MSIKAEAKFNNGNGGVMVIISKETGRLGGMGGMYEVEEIGELLSPRKAIDLALQLIHKAAVSVPDELDAAIRELKSQRGMW